MSAAQHWKDEHDRVAAELARVSRELAECRDSFDEVEATATRLLREHETMRDALEHILTAYHARDPEDTSLLPFQMKEIALRALAGSRAATPEELRELGDCLPPPWPTETVECQKCGAEHPADPEVRTYSGCPSCAATPEAHGDFDVDDGWDTPAATPEDA